MASAEREAITHIQGQCPRSGDQRVKGQRVPGLFAPETFRSRERPVHVDKFCSLENSYPRNCRSLRISHPGNFTIPNFQVKKFKLCPAGGHRPARRAFAA